MSSSPETYPKPLRQGRPTRCRSDTHVPLAKKILTAATDAGCAHVVAGGHAVCAVVVGGEEGGERGRWPQGRASDTDE